MDINSIALKGKESLSARILRNLLIITSLIVLLMVSVVSSDLSAESRDSSNPDYITFWSDYKNILKFQPNLIKTLFMQIIDLKGNSKTAKRVINYEVLGCRTEVSFNAGCRIDELKLLKKKEKISYRYTIPVNFTGFSTRPYKSSKSKSIVRLSWRPALFRPSLLDVDTFLNYINAARNSKIYALKPGLERMQLFPNFQKHIEIIIDNVMARNLSKLYVTPHHDFKDAVTFELASTHNSMETDIISFSLDLIAVTVKVNHLVYRVQRDALLN